MPRYTRILRSVIALSLLVAVDVPLLGQGLNSIPSVDSVAKFEAIPSDLAFEMLGLSGSTIQQPGTISKLLASLSQTTDKQGHLSTGVAITITPWQMIKGDNFKPGDYINDCCQRLLSNIQVSLGTAPSTEADSSLDWGMGMRVVVADPGDGRLDTMSYEPLIKSTYGILKDESSDEPAVQCIKEGTQKEELNKLNIQKSDLVNKANKEILLSNSSMEALQETIKETEYNNDKYCLYSFLLKNCSPKHKILLAQLRHKWG